MISSSSDTSWFAKASKHAAQPESTTQTSQADSALRSETLLRGKKNVDILHNGSRYKLQATKLGKLILTK
ncbi:hemin uptake protein HemP [Variovorax sp. PCZ-1]|uniref:hemin uptake protein HemP n=1 Tax=Variovorax sp. PCZ-1 TaxID=2835533 RepID=UPI001BCE78FB|nr:hemin uptake protein HemP [Variovorax sp. PCZ-1]MBS7807732.1 hemin uptake protein HemP [Variovorax sp. PCZ-1]